MKQTLAGASFEQIPMMQLGTLDGYHSPPSPLPPKKCHFLGSQPLEEALSLKPRAQSKLEIRFPYRWTQVLHPSAK